jgi:hypothetical protein
VERSITAAIHAPKRVIAMIIIIPIFLRRPLVLLSEYPDMGDSFFSTWKSGVTVEATVLSGVRE